MLGDVGRMCTTSTRDLTRTRFADCVQMHNLLCNVLYTFLNLKMFDDTSRTSDLADKYQSYMMNLINFCMITEEPLLKINLLVLIESLILNSKRYFNKGCENVLMAQLSHLMNALCDFSKVSDIFVCSILNQVGAKALSAIEAVYSIIGVKIKPYIDLIIDALEFNFNSSYYHKDNIFVASKFLNRLVNDFKLDFRPYVAHTLKALKEVLLIAEFVDGNQDILDQMEEILKDSWGIYKYFLQNMFYQVDQPASYGMILFIKKLIKLSFKAQ
ncbi:hypothetical protein RF11_00790 [Thelohanellus kitauei]|uniref:Uncharacterized protein n=1 Tax=Thelohanellus kitauei TaxID=669202 RepID=A0A0C2J189_THEKT|nr:hypothetical protein RF11_00790 [Thelohanellus kitauei]